MQLNDLQYLEVLWETLNFHETARKCKVSQSTISRAVARIEDHLGGSLFTREGRTVWPSAFGRAMQPVLGKLRQSLDAADAQASRLLKNDEGLIRIGIADTVPFHLVENLFSTYRSTYPQTEIELSFGSSDTIGDALKNAALDGVIKSIDQQSRENHNTLALYHDHFALAGATIRQLPLKAASTNSSDKSSTNQNLLVQTGQLSDDNINHIRNLERLEDTALHQINRPDWLSGMAQTGFGLALLPAEQARSAGLFIHRTFDTSLPTWELALVTARGRPFTPAMRAFHGLATKIGKQDKRPAGERHRQSASSKNGVKGETSTNRPTNPALHVV